LKNEIEELKLNNHDLNSKIDRLQTHGKISESLRQNLRNTKENYAQLIEEGKKQIENKEYELYTK